MIEEIIETKEERMCYLNNPELHSFIKKLQAHEDELEIQMGLIVGFKHGMMCAPRINGVVLRIVTKIEEYVIEKMANQKDYENKRLTPDEVGDLFDVDSDD